MTADGLSVPSEAVEWVCRSIRSAGSCPAAIVRERPVGSRCRRVSGSADAVSRRVDVVAQRKRRRGAAGTGLRDEPGRQAVEPRDAPAQSTPGWPPGRSGTSRGQARPATASAGRPAAWSRPPRSPGRTRCPAASRWFSRSRVVNQPSNVLASTLPTLADAVDHLCAADPGSAGAHGHPHGLRSRRSRVTDVLAGQIGDDVLAAGAERDGLDQAGDPQALTRSSRRTPMV